jgi:phage-related minor tail protein
MKANQARIDAEKAAYDALAEEFKKYQSEVDSLFAKIKGQDVINAAKQWSDAMRDAGDNVSLLSAKVRDELGAAMRGALEAMARNGTLTQEQSSRYTELMLKIDAYNASLKKQTEVILPAASGAVTDYTQKLYDQARAADAANQAAGGGASGNVGGSTATEGYVVPVNPTTSGSGAGSSYYLPPRRAAGGPVAGGTSYLVGEKGPELFTPGANGAISPNGAGAVVYNTINIVDTEANLARRVSDHILRSVTQARRV